VIFTNANCLVEIEGEQSELPRYVAHLAVFEEEVGVVRPLVAADGRRVTVHAESESLALNSAIAFLAGRFGSLSEPERACSLGNARIGRPFVMKD
jgi:hypothetical protein